MSSHVQIDPRAEALAVSHDFIEAIEPFVQNFDIRYCGLDSSDAQPLIARLRALTPKFTDEQRAIATIVRLLVNGEPVELLSS